MRERDAMPRAAGRQTKGHAVITRIKRYLRKQWTSWVHEARRVLKRRQPPQVLSESALPATSLTRSWPSVVKPAVAADTITKAVAHLRYLGYAISDGPGEWKYAEHPRRDFFLSAFPVGISLSTNVAIGASIDNTRASWLEFLNDLNNRSHVTRFSLYQNEIGAYRIRMHARFSGEYSRWVFAILMDMWQLDVDRVYDKLTAMPASEGGPSIAADTEAAPMTVH